MKRRTFIQAVAALAALPLAALEAAPPAKRRGLSSEEIDEFVNLTIQQFNEQSFKELSRKAVLYKGIEIDWIAFH